MVVLKNWSLLRGRHRHAIRSRIYLSLTYSLSVYGSGAEPEGQLSNLRAMILSWCDVFSPCLHCIAVNSILLTRRLFGAPLPLRQPEPKPRREQPWDVPKPGDLPQPGQRRSGGPSSWCPPASHVTIVVNINRNLLTGFDARCLLNKWLWRVSVGWDISAVWAAVWVRLACPSEGQGVFLARDSLREDTGHRTGSTGCALATKRYPSNVI